MLAFLQASDRHPDARALYEQVSHVLPRVSLATIYRTLAILREAGFVRELKHGPVCRYDANVEGHHHAHCIRCGQVRDVIPGPAPDLAAFVADGFEVLSHRVEVRGICRACQPGE